MKSKRSRDHERPPRPATDSSAAEQGTPEPDLRESSSLLAFERETKGCETSTDLATAFLTIDTIAKGSLSPPAFARYEAYKRALIDHERDIPSTVLTLSLFVWDLLEERERVNLH